MANLVRGRGLSFNDADGTRLAVHTTVPASRRVIRATAQQELAARLCGVNARHVYAVTFGVSAAFAGASGAILGIVLLGESMEPMRLASIGLIVAGIVGLMMVTSALLSVVAFRGALEVWHLAVASFINGCGWATDNPLRRVMMGEVMGRDRMAIAMALDVGAGNVSRMVGPAVGGLLLAGVGIEGAFLLSVALYASAVAATLMVQSHIPSSPGAGAVLARTWEGVALIFSDRRLGAIMAVTVIYNVFAWPFTSMIPVIGTDRLLLGPEGVGLLTSIDGVGAFAGCLLLALWLTPGWHARAYVGGTAAYLVGLIGFAAAPTPLLAGVALLVTGLAGATFATLQATLVYLAAPIEMRSRILGVLSVCIGTGPIGFVWLGWLADLIGAPEATAITGVMGLLALAATWPLWRRI